MKCRLHGEEQSPDCGDCVIMRVELRFFSLRPDWCSNWRKINTLSKWEVPKFENKPKLLGIISIFNKALHYKG